MRLNETFDDGQSKSAASGGRAGSAEEFVEDAGKPFVRNAWTAIRDAQDEIAIPKLRLHLNRRACGRVIGSVEKQIRQGVLHERNVEPDQQRTGRDVHPHRVQREFALQFAQRRLNHIARVMPVEARTNLAGFKPCHVEQVADNAIAI